MDKQNHPVSFGVFKPVGHTVVAWRTEADLQAAVQALLEAGFASDALVRYTPAEMLAQADGDLGSASPMAAIGQELNLVKSQRELAAEGCWFLVVHAPDDDEAARLDAVLARSPAVTAQRYGHLLIEELVATPPGVTQVAESPERGLDPGGRPTPVS
jgi:hypothetical protein